jgi:hypothetical protein
MSVITLTKINGGFSLNIDGGTPFIVVDQGVSTSIR